MKTRKIAVEKFPRLGQRDPATGRPLGWVLLVAGSHGSTTGL